MKRRSGRQARALFADVLLSFLQMHRAITVGDQRWTVSFSDVYLKPPDQVSVDISLRGPYGRSRSARLDVALEQLSEGRFDPSLLVGLLLRWLPHSDSEDVLLISGDQVATTKPPA